MQLLFQFTAKINVVELRLPLRCTFTRSQAQFLFHWGEGAGLGLQSESGVVVNYANWQIGIPTILDMQLFRLPDAISP